MRFRKAFFGADWRGVALAISFPNAQPAASLTSIALASVHLLWPSEAEECVLFAGFDRQVRGPATQNPEGKAMKRSTLTAPIRLGLMVLAAGCATEPEPPRAVSIAVSPGDATLTFLGQSTGFTATVTDQYGAEFAGTVTWTSDAPAVFSVNSGGLVTAVSNGTGTVRATLSGVSGIATVTVSQAATTLERVGGDAQRGSPRTPLSEPLVALVLDGGDNPVAGAAVSFTPAAGSGIVTPATAPTDMAGEARVSWTLGDAVGLQSVVASVAEGPNAVFTATALGTPAEIDVVAGADQETAVATAVAVPPEVLVTDAGGGPLSGIPVVFTTEGGATVANSEVHTDAQGRADPGAWTLGTATGAYRLTASVEGDGIAGNPLHIEAVALSGPVSGLVAVEGDGQQAEIAIPVRVAPRVRVEDLYGNPAAGVRVAFSATGDSEVIPAETRTDSAGFAAVDRWTLGVTVGTTYSLTAGVTTADRTTATVTFTAEATASVYDIEIVHVSSSLLTDSQRAAFVKAEQFWERAITGNLRWTTIRRPALEECLARNDIAEDVPGDRVVDDLLIYVQIKEIDGPAGVFGGAGPCQIRVNDSLPAVGVMYFDLGDMARLETNGHLEGTILHEMAHVIGFGTLWAHLGLLQDPARLGRSANTHFTGEAAIAAFDEIRGDNYTDSDLVPVQNLGGEGVWNGHWRELVFRSELMTPFPDRGLNPLSAVSIASFVDIGYTGVDYGVADEYALPPPLYAVVAEGAEGAPATESVAAGVEAQAAGVGVAAEGAPRDAIGPGKEILLMPLAVVDRDGNVVRRLTPPER